MKISFGKIIKFIYLEKTGNPPHRKIQALDIRNDLNLKTSVFTGLHRLYLMEIGLSWESKWEMCYAG